ncbi:Transcription and mRNA export factor ENY2 [Paramicrosporidium saccamoebae]|uniref:Transcription and mRNA export factor SUS1 n=1 Tax=Paramicrosporidium saccamoebae TaxID=1246581 RepID=A0A2H9TFR1_9FUNG|nr:Transcription and mRNA export factor ENY2 [Paramicrosporidium saccamoebae]
MSGVDEELVRKINEALITSGERDRLKQLVREKLTKAGWYDREVKARNVDSITPQELSTILYPKASDLIPTQVRTELEGEIRQFLDAHIRIA